MSPKHIISPPKGKKKEQREEPRIEIFLIKLNAELSVDSNEQAEKLLIFVNDISHNGLGVFLEHEIPTHSNVTIKVTTPKNVTIKGRVSWCNKYTNSMRIITAKNYCYRAGIRFLFANDQEKNEVSKLIRELKEILANHF